MNKWEYPVRITERRSSETMTLEVFIERDDAKLYLRTFVEARPQGHVAQHRLSGTYYDGDHDNIMKVWIGRRLRG